MALGSAWKQMSWLYYQYLLVTALYMLEPWERTVFSGPGLPGAVRMQRRRSGLGSYRSVALLHVLLCSCSRIRNSMLVSIVGMALYTGYVFMPQHIMAILHYFEIVQ